VIVLRRLLLDHRTLALWLAVAALTVKLLVPAGFMVGVVDGRVSLQICSGFGPVVAAPTMDHAMAGHVMPGPVHDTRAMPDHRGETEHDGAEHAGVAMPCAFAALAHGAVAAADAVVLASAIAFVLALGFAAVVRPAARRVPFLRPPLRGPPILS
jgi:hypothetical protein